MLSSRPYLYLRGLRQVDHTVFSVANGQKTYYEPVFNRKVPFSSGQQVKRSILDLMSELLGEGRASITFNWELKVDPKTKKETMAQKEPWSPCDPAFADQLIGGWMRAQSAERTIKRRSPLSISAMHPLHPLLSGLSREDITFDRSDHPEQHQIVVRDENGKEVPKEKIYDFLLENNRALPMRIWIPGDKVGDRAHGLFVYDVAIDLRLLFSVSLNEYDPELTPEKRDELVKSGWGKSKDGTRLICPKHRRDAIIPALAESLIHWHITSNQARTYSPQNTLAIALSNNASRISGAIRADLRDGDPERPRAEPVLDPKIEGVELFTTLAAMGYVAEVVGSADALEKAEQSLMDRLSTFDYDSVSYTPGQPRSVPRNEATA
jgi:hypothetical protein